MTGNRIGDYEQWPTGGVRPTLPVLRILAETYGTTWDQLVDARDLRHMPESDRLEYLEKGLGPAPRPAGAETPPTPSSRQGSRGRVSGDDLIAAVAEESQEFGEWAGTSEVADATIGQYQAQTQRLARCSSMRRHSRCCWRALAACADHLSHEESGVLAAFARRADPALWQTLRHQWLAFRTAWTPRLECTDATRWPATTHSHRHRLGEPSAPATGKEERPWRG